MNFINENSQILLEVVPLHTVYIKSQHPFSFKCITKVHKAQKNRERKKESSIDILNCIFVESVTQTFVQTQSHIQLIAQHMTIGYVHVL